MLSPRKKLEKFVAENKPPKSKKVKIVKASKTDIENKFAELYKYIDEKAKEFNEKLDKLIKKDEEVHTQVAPEEAGKETGTGTPENV